MTEDSLRLSETKRSLLHKYLHGDIRRSSPGKALLSPRPRERTVPLSLGQQQVWLHAQLAGGLPAYHETICVRRKGPLDVPAVERSLNEIVRRHEAWRTVFPVVDGGLVQVINAPSPLALPTVDLRSLDEAAREPEALRLASADARQPFDLARGPLLRARLVRLADDEHRLFLTLHHLIFDGVSLYGIFLPELAALYEAFSTGQSSPLPEVQAQYADYVYWQQEWLQGDSVSEHTAYWKKQLAGALPVLELPTDHPRPAVLSFRGAMERFALSPSVRDALAALSQREGVTLYMTLLAAFTTLLHRYSGQDDILVGGATSGRNHPQLEKVMGFVLNTVVLRASLSGNPTFRELLGRVREVTLEALSHDAVPFAHLVKELHPQRDPSRHALFQVLFTLEPRRTFLESGWDLTALDVETGASRFDLSLEMDDRPEGLIGRFVYNTDIFDGAALARMRGHWQTLLHAIAADPSLRLGELALLTGAERRELATWNDTRRAYPSSCVHELFEAQVERTPNAVAVVCEGHHLTFRGLNERANQVAHHLRRLGVGPETLVGICVERSLELVEGLLGILKAGGAYVPLDPEYPKERLAFMMRDSELAVVLTQAQLGAKFSEFGSRLVFLDSDRAVITQESSENCHSGVAPENVAYVIYTSGSTGRPKGVEITHRSLVNFLTAMRHEPGLAAEDTLLAITTISFDIAALELYLPLVTGARLVVLDRDTARDGPRLKDKLATTGATFMQATPATWRLLVDAGWEEGGDLKILCGGEALPRELANALVRRSRSVWNMYGPTETTVWSTMHRVEEGEGSVLIGRPIANTETYVLDDRLQPVPVGVAGELHIGGDGVARGYRNRPELTAEKFVPHPFRHEPDARLYRTGDRVRYRPDGHIEFLGRLDDQVKIRGLRIELGEIEALLGSHPSVREAVVLAREDVPGERRLVGYIVPHPERALSPTDVYSFLRERLPEYMIPTLMALEALPRTPNGKVDRRALPAPDRSRPAGEEAPAKPRTAVEEVIAGIWSQVLGVEDVLTFDNFFDLGGHSLLAMQVIAGIENKLGLRINPREIMFQTLGQLAAACEDRLQSRALSQG
jgi:amino acid adenylation domain-containing protein